MDLGGVLMSRFSGNRRLVRAILDGVAEMHRLHSDQGQFDSHDLINWMNDHENAALNELIALYHGDDPVRAATVQVSNFLKNEVGQQKTHNKQVSHRRITLNGGASRDGDSKVSVWEISASTREGLSRARRVLLEDKQPAVPPHESAPADLGWIAQIIGTFKDEPAFSEVLAYGRAFRHQDRPLEDDDS
jgi:hypothetical protein